MGIYPLYLTAWEVDWFHLYLSVGLGLGLLIGYCIVVETQPGYFMENVGYAVRETVSIIYGASVLLGGGLGLIVAFVIEVMRASRNK